MKSYKIGIDTGGTYTDAVVFDPVEKKVLKSVKALTSHGRLELGIVSALKELFQDKKAVYRVSDIGLVSLSTTLATNSLVEKKGTDPGVVLIGFSDDMEKRSHLKDLVSQERILRIPGGHRYDGSEKNPLNLLKLQQFLETSGKSLKNFAVASNYSVRNSEHEILAGELIEKMTRGRVSLSSGLTSDLNSPRRAYSATLNAKIQTLMEELVDAVKRAMGELKLKVPLMMVKSDGSIDPVERALDRPIETVASGPAASVIGACSLTGLKDFVISDIGGTTTDTAVVEGGWPLVEKHHAIMQERATSIPSIRVRSYALGGDSEVNPEKEGELEILSRRVVPVSLMAHHYPQVLQNLEEVSRTEENIAEDTRELAQADDADLAKRKTNEKIKETADDQRDNAEELKDLAREGAKALMEAMRNPAFDEQTLRDWAQNLKSMNELADQQMKQAQSKLGQAAQESQPQEKKENLADALEEEEEARDELADLQDKVNKDLDNLQALTLAQRLRKLSKEELALRKKIKDIIQETIGLMPEDLPERYTRANTRFTKSQGRTQEKAVELQGEISRFYERTGKGQYGEVSKEMETEKTGESLSEIETQIESNINMLAIRNLGNWAGKFEGWAEMLEPPKPEDDGGGQGGGQGGGEKKENNLMKLLFSMLRLRESELRHQQQTTLVEQQKGDAETYKKGVERLSKMHADSMLDLNRLQFENAEPAMLDPLQETFDAMEVTDNFLEKPQTDAATTTSQANTIRHMSDVINLINEEIKRDQNQQGQSKAQQEMAFMMAMMAMKQQMGQGMQQGQTAGGSQAGGSTDRVAGGLTGDATGREDASRTISRGSGAVTKLPEEFRDALQGYFEAVEAIEGGEQP